MTKRTVDLFVVIAAAPLWVPVLAVVAVHVRTKLGAPVFFGQPLLAADRARFSS